MKAEVLEKLHLREEDGVPLAVVRPSKPELAIEIARSTINTDKWEEACQRMNRECGPYLFVGYLGKTPKFTGALAKHKARTFKTPVFDEDGTQVDTVAVGDSFVGPEWFEAMKPVEEN